MARKPIRAWRVVEAQPHGLMVWFDPRTEFVRLFELKEPPIESGVGDLCEGDDLDGPTGPIQLTMLVDSDELPF